MKITYEGKQYLISSENAFDLSIKNNFSGDAPTFYNSSQPSCEPLVSENFIGNIQKGGSCNVPIVSINIHCTGTHTECEGHVNDSNSAIVDICPIDFIPASLITISPEQANRTEESYHVALTEDMVITKNAINNANLIHYAGNHKPWTIEAGCEESSTIFFNLYQELNLGYYFFTKKNRLTKTLLSIISDIVSLKVFRTKYPMKYIKEAIKTMIS